MGSDRSLVYELQVDVVGGMGKMEWG